MMMGQMQVKDMSGYCTRNEYCIFGNFRVKNFCCFRGLAHKLENLTTRKFCMAVSA